jgi:hypothetical protein
MATRRPTPPCQNTIGKACWLAPPGCDPGMAAVQYESKENAGHKYWTGRYGRYAVRIGANRPGVYRWPINMERLERRSRWGPIALPRTDAGL